MNPAQYIRRSDVPAMYGITFRILSGWQKKGLLPYSKPSRKLVLFRVKDIEAVLARFEIKGAIPGGGAE